MSRSLRIFLACGLGAFIGSMFGLSFTGITWGILGMALGGAFGYIFVDYEEIISSVPVAYMATKYVVRVRGVEKLKSKRHDLEMWFYGLLLFSVFPVGIITLVWMFPTEASMKQTFGSHGVSIVLSMVIGCTMYC
jgi:hypothetical protein